MDATQGIQAQTVANAFEAIVGALFLDGGFEAARAFVLRELEPVLRAARDTPGAGGDPKSALQVACLQGHHAVPRYKVLIQAGLAHSPRFTVEVTLPDGRTFQGCGRSKKDAEQAAATEANRSLHPASDDPEGSPNP